MQITKQQHIELLVAFLLVVASIWLLVSIVIDRKAPLGSEKLVNVNPNVVIGSNRDFDGNPAAPFTLVEFGDYECPPCRRANYYLRTLLKRHSDRVRCQFRNYPLMSLHPLSHAAAVVAEIARLDHKFWSVHDALYADELSNQKIRNVIASNSLANSMNNTELVKRANLIIDTDSQIANKLGVNGTPTFFLCCPDHKVMRLVSIDQLQLYINNSKINNTK